MLLDQFGKPIALTETPVTVDLDNLDIVMNLETRPSALSGFNYWLTLTYKTHQFEEMFPQEFAGWSEEIQDAKIQDAAQRLRAHLRPILMAEDEPKLRLVK